MKYFSQNVNLDRHSQYSVEDLKDVINTNITLDLSSSSLFNDVLSIYSMINLNNNMQTIDVLSNYTFTKKIEISSDHFIGIGQTNGTNGIINIIGIYGFENRKNIIQNFNNAPNQVNSQYPFYNLNYYIDLLNTLDFDYTKDTLLLSQGNNYPICELIIKLKLITNGKIIKSYCFNPGRSLTNSNYSSITEFYYYDNGYSYFIPEYLMPTKIVNKVLTQTNEIKLFLPLSTNFILYLSGENPTVEYDKIFMPFFAYKYYKNLATFNTLEYCQNYFTLNNESIPSSLPIYTSSLNIDTYSDISQLINLIIQSYTKEVENYTITKSSNKNLVLIKDSNNNAILYCNKTQTLNVTSTLVDITTNGKMYKIDNVINSNNVLIDEITEFNNSLNLSGINQLLVFGMNAEIHLYIHLLTKLNTMNNKFIIILGLSSITKDFTSFNDLGFKDVSIINIFNDITIVQNTQNYDIYDKISYSVMYDIDVNDQICMNTIFGYSNYLQQ